MSTATGQPLAVRRRLGDYWSIVFSICVNNTDDHVRNHGFLPTDQLDGVGMGTHFGYLIMF